MNRASLVFSAAALGLAVAACDDGSNGQLLEGAPLGEMATDPTSVAAGPGNTHHHFNESIGGDNGLTDPQQVQADNNAVGSPEAVARLHGTQKISYAALGGMLADMGVDLTAKQGAGQLFRSGGSALGMPVYANRVPEQMFPSTSSLAKQFDIFTAAVPEIVANIGSSKRCPGVTLVDATSGQFTADGLTCLMGKPVSSEHLALANQIVSQASTPEIGQQIALGALLSASHTTE